MLRIEIWVDDDGVIARYNLSYINPLRYPHDNGRVLGYDNAHGRHHRHLMGKVTTVDFRDFAQLERRFCAEWHGLMKEKEIAKNSYPS
jgi:CHASE1-domain containing sensor protein